MHSSRHVAQVLRDTIKSIEQGTDLPPDDPALIQLKRILLTKLAELELQDATESAVTVMEPVQILPHTEQAN